MSWVISVLVTCSQILSILLFLQQLTFLCSTDLYNLLNVSAQVGGCDCQNGFCMIRKGSYFNTLVRDWNVDGEWHETIGHLQRQQSPCLGPGLSLLAKGEEERLWVCDGKISDLHKAEEWIPTTRDYKLDFEPDKWVLKGQCFFSCQFSLTQLGQL